MNDLDLNKFLIIFNKIWQDFVDDAVILPDEQDVDFLNAIMFGNGGIISRVTEESGTKVPPNSIRSSHGFDAILISNNNGVIAEIEYPVEVKAVIKHVKGSNDLQAAWDLIHWRTPLKIFVFYEDCDDDANCVKAAISNIYSLIDDVDSFNVESDITEYLFLVLQDNKTNDNLPIWYWSSNYQRKPRKLTDDGALDLAKVIATKKRKCGANLPQKFEYSFELNQPFEDVISLHGALHRKINRIVDSINQECKGAGLSVDNACIRTSTLSGM